MFTTGSAIKNNTTTYFITGATANSTVTGVKTFEIPPNCNFLTITACGAGGGGGGGCGAATTVQRWGGGGGASGTVMSSMFPRFALPSILYISIGAGGTGGAGNTAGTFGANTFVSTTPSNTAGLIVQATGGNQGAAGTTSVTGTAGAAQATAFSYASGEQGTVGYFAWSPNYTFYDGRPGMGNNFTSFPNTYFTCVSGGVAGGYANSAAGVAYRTGYGFYLPIGNSGAYEQFGIYYGGVLDASNVSLPGDGGFMSLNPFLMSGGTGGGGVKSGTGFAGGPGAPGCGGGGGGAGGTIGGRGGDGGDGWVLINCW
jgi:hypothetical protein